MNYSAEAERHVEALRQHYEALNRIEAVKNLLDALIDAEASIRRDPAAGLKAPRPYPLLAKAGCLWTKAGRYWIAYTVIPTPTVLAVFFDEADIPGRLRSR